MQVPRQTIYYLLAHTARITKQSLCKSEIMENRALKRFLDRRRSPTSFPTPPRPEGRANHAPLELLSSVALKQLRLNISPNESTFRSIPRPPVLENLIRCGCEQEASSARLSPVSLDSFQPDPYTPLNASSRIRPAADMRLQRSFSVGEGSRVDCQRQASTSPSSSDHIAMSSNSSLADAKFVPRRIVKQSPNTSGHGTAKPRCQSSKFCHICR